MDEHGLIFLLDRDPDIFQVVLNYLRNGEVDMSPNVTRYALLREAHYYNLNGLMETLRNVSEFPSNGSGVTDSSEGRMDREELTRVLARSDVRRRPRLQGLDLHGMDLSKMDFSCSNMRFIFLLHEAM